MKSIKWYAFLAPLFPQLSVQSFGSGRPIEQVEAAVAQIETKFASWLNFTSDVESFHLQNAHKAAVAKPPANFWLGKIQHRGVAPYAAPGYQVFRNVLDFGATGDGVTDDTDAINLAISSGNRCGPGACQSTTVTPAIVYFPPGEYLVSSSIFDYYFTMLIGDAVNLPILKASPDFGGSGLGVIDGNMFHQFGSTNTFYRQIANFIIDLTAVPPVNSQGGGPTGIHWPTAQATSIQNVKILMSEAPNTAHQGIFIEDGSAGFISDITFVGGKFGAQFGNQQFTMRNLTFQNAQTAIYHGFDWGWVYAGITIQNCSVGIDMTALTASGTLNVGSITMIDSVVKNTDVFIKTARNATSLPVTGGSLALENIQLKNVPIAIQGPSGETVLKGAKGQTTIDGYLAGHTYTPKGPVTVEGPSDPFPRPPSLVTASGAFYTQSRPQYEDLRLNKFVSVRDYGAAGDATTDDTAALNAAITAATAANKILFIDAGIYKVTKTISIPPGTRIFGEAYPNIMGSGSFFTDASNPNPVVQVGKPGQKGRVEWSNVVVSTRGATHGAILIEHNLASPASNPSGMWDVHVRIGGFMGSNLQLATCIMAVKERVQTSTVTQNICSFENKQAPSVPTNSVISLRTEGLEVGISG